MGKCQNFNIEEFERIFNQKVYKYENELRKRYNEQNTNYTTFMNILLAEALGNMSNNYILYDRSKQSPLQEGYYFSKEERKFDFSTWYYYEKNMWHFTSIIEHENNGETWLQEFEKMVQVRCNAKVIITYGQGNKDNKGVHLIETANRFIKLYANEYDILKEEWLILFGPDSSELLPYKNLEFKSYRLNKESLKFEPSHTYQK